MVELQPSKLTVRVRFSSPAPNSQLTSLGMFFFMIFEICPAEYPHFKRIRDRESLNVLRG